MLVSKQDLARLLSATVKVVESRNTIPILSTVRLVGKDGQLQVTATDLDIEITGSIPAEGSLEACVDAKLLAAVVNKAGGTEIDITPNDGNVVVKSGRNRSTLNTLPVDDFPTMAAGNLPVEFTADLSELFAPVQFAVSTEETRYYLNGVYLHVDKGRMVAVATDGHRLGRNSVQEPQDQPPLEFEGIIIPRKTVGILPKGEVTVRLSNTKIQFLSGGTTITSKLIDGTFPDYQRVIPTGNDKIVTFDVPAMKQAAERVSVISSERGRAVKLSFSDNQAVLSVANPDRGTATEEIAVGYDGEPLEIGFNSAYLTELVSQFPAGDVRMTLADAGSPTVFTSDKADGYLAVLMPMRV